jgi:hypothetical protein
VVPDPTPVILLAVSLSGAAVAGWLTPRRPLAAFGILFALAALTRPTIETPIGTMRLEQPAIAVVGVVLVATGRLRDLRTLPRWVWAMAGCLALYLAILAISSVLMAPDRGVSLRLVAWWALSLAGCAEAVLLVDRRGREAILPLGLVGAATGLIGIGAAIVFLAFGPAVEPGIQNADSVLPRVYGLGWEANLYAGFLAACVPFGLELARTGRDRRLGIAIAAVLLVSMPLGVTRGAFVGLAVGSAVYLATVLWRERRPMPAAVLATMVALVTVVGIGASDVLLPNEIERSSATTGALPSPGPGGTAVPGTSGEPLVSAPPPTPLPSLRAQTDTFAFRMKRVPVALDDIAKSPLIGLGAESFGQRHGDPTQGGAPDHIAILAVAAVYEAGVVGALALVAAFVILALALWRATRVGAAVGAGAAYLGSVAALLAAYQATNALHFAINWLIAGAAIALAAWPPGGGGDQTESVRDAAPGTSRNAASSAASSASRP